MQKGSYFNEKFIFNHFNIFACAADLLYTKRHLWEPSNWK